MAAVEELGGVGVQPAARRLEHRRVPAVAAEHLVGALAATTLRSRLTAWASSQNATRSCETIGSLIAAIARGSAARSSSVPTRIWWWSVPYSAATRSENANSFPSRPPASGKPIENVASPRWPCSASSATIRLESSPPESSTPTGTSETIRRRTATRSASSSASRHSSGERSPPRSCGGFQYSRSRRRPSGSTVSTVAGASLRTPVRIVRGAGTTECQLR